MVDSLFSAHFTVFEQEIKYADLIAAVLGVINVWLTLRQNIWCWPVGIVMTALGIVVFYRATLYADFGLYIFFFLQQFYGWYFWIYGGEKKDELPVRWTP